MAVEAPPGRMEQARAGMRRAALKRQVEAVAAGSGDRLPIDLEDGAFDVATVVAEVAWPLQPQSAALTAGLRRRHTAVGPLLALLDSGTRRHRAISCRALGWMRAGTAIPALTSALSDPDWRVRMAAAKALGELHAQAQFKELDLLLTDRDPRVRKAAKQSLRLGNVMLSRDWRWAWR